MNCRRRVLCIPTERHIRRVFSKETLERLKRLFDVTFNELGRDYTSEEVAEKISGYDALITGWGSPPLTEDFFKNADRLRIIAHSAGSVKYMISKDLIERYVLPRDICIVSARRAIAYNVAESTIGLIIMACHRFIDHVISIREKLVWRDPSIPSDFKGLMGSVIGVVGASTVGRIVINLLKPFNVKILVYDPYLSEWEAGRLGVEKTSLEDLFRRSDIVTVHAPLTEETEGMIGERHLKLLRDGAILVNTSRGRVIDHEALLRECRTGRIIAVLDVTDPEPLPPDSPFRRMRNVIITPHVAGLGRYGRYMIGRITLESLEDYFSGKIPRDALDMREYDRLA